jgi:putative acyl-CoA dehydrogenase
MFMLMAQAESGFGCPISMTYAAVPALRAEPEVAAEWEPRLTALVYDPRVAPAADKLGALSGMAMTERQGGSDVQANTTRAAPAGDGGYVLNGEKWFCSAPMCDVFLVLAQAPGGLSCFLLPRWRTDRTRNAFHVRRLKDKLGNRSNASSEVEFHGAIAHLVGEEGRGVQTIIEMVNHTRLDCVLGSTALMRKAVAEATHHAAHRSAFGRLLADQPLMQNVLADLAVESEAATMTALRLARAYDDASAHPGARPLARLVTAVAKYWICKRTPPLVAEALECLGGNGYVEDSGMPRLFRESPLNSIWEGSGNVICLDVLRAMRRTPEVVEAFFAEVALAEGAEPRLDAFGAKLRDDVAGGAEGEIGARRLVERMALALQGSLMVRHGHPAVAAAFAASRLEGDHGLAFGTLPPGLDLPAVVERAGPVTG